MQAAWVDRSPPRPPQWPTLALAAALACGLLVLLGADGVPNSLARHIRPTTSWSWSPSHVIAPHNALLHSPRSPLSIHWQARSIESRALRAQPAPSAVPPNPHASAVSDAAAALELYAERASSPEPPLLGALRDATAQAYPLLASRMLSGPLQGRLLKTLAVMAGVKDVLELGTFTGYSALCFAEALPAGGRVVTIDSDEKAQGIAKDFFRRSDVGHKVEARLGQALDVLAALRAEGRQFDLVFLDADKKKYVQYYEALLGNETDPGLLAPKGVILADNVLWKGLVLAHDPDLAAHTPAPASAGRPERMATMAAALHRFNAHVRADPRTEVVLIPLRDGLTLIRRH
eukprot:EG_transcript_16005